MTCLCFLEVVSELGDTVTYTMNGVVPKENKSSKVKGKNDCVNEH